MGLLTTREIARGVIREGTVPSWWKVQGRNYSQRGVRYNGGGGYDEYYGGSVASRRDTRGTIRLLEQDRETLKRSLTVFFSFFSHIAPDAPFCTYYL